MSDGGCMIEGCIVWLIGARWKRVRVGRIEKTKAMWAEIARSC